MNEEIINSTICTIHSPEDVSYIEKLIKLGEYFKMSDLVNKTEPMLYAFILETKNPLDQYIIHIGCTKNLLKRFKSLKYEYQCEIYFIGCKILDNIKEGLKFHSLIKEKNPTLIEKSSMENKSKRKLYKLSHLIIEEFRNYSHQTLIKFDKIHTKLTKQKIRLVFDLKNELEYRNFIIGNI